MITQANSYIENSEFKPTQKLDIESLVKAKLPPMKGTVMRILELLRDDNASISSLAVAVGCDPILTARLLRLANSPIYSPQRTVTTIRKAIESVGTKSLYDLVILDMMAEGFSKEIRNSVLIRSLWEHSVVVGLLARELVKVLGLRSGEEAFVCGLLHDIGKFLMLSADFQRFETLLDQKTEREMLDWEEDVFGYNHTEVGAYVVNKWRFPDTIASVIMYHHQPSQATISLVMANVVNVANMIANIYGYGLRLEDDKKMITSESVAFLKLGRHQMLQAWDDIQDEIEEVFSMFR